MSNWVGQTLGKVRIDTLLARGGTAEVYVGTHLTLQREVAIKVLHNNYDDHPHALERFQREAMVVGKLRHPNIVQVFDFDTTADSHPYLVMEYIKGPSLLKYLNALHSKGERLDFPHVVRLMNAMTSALQYAHDSGVIHRDIKPGNILLTSRSSEIILGKALPDDFEPVLTDFGLVRFIDSTQHTTGSGQIAGTPAYMSPEQARGDLTDGRTDIYSLGIVLYEILAGHLPFEGETTMGVLMKHINEPPAPVPGLPPSMQYVLDRALAKSVDDRFQTPDEFGQAFNEAVVNKNDYSTLDMLSTKPVPTTRKAKKIFGQTKKQRNWVGPVLGAVIVMALGGTLLLKGLPFAAAGNTVTNTASILPPSVTASITRTPVPAYLLGRTGVLHFQNGSAFADEATLIAEALLAPPPGSQYELWLANAKERISLGILTLDENGKGKLTFDQANKLNLVTIYDRVEVSIEPSPDNNPASSGIIAYSFTSPADGLTHVRNLLSAYANTPNQTALIQGFYADIKSINDLAVDMQKASGNNNDAQIDSDAEAINNIIVGSESSAHKDWNKDNKIADPGDGYGLNLNSRNLGYLQAVYTEADATVKSLNPSSPMIEYGNGLISCVGNLAQWTPELQNLITQILNHSAGSDRKQLIADVATLTEKMLNGVDADENGRIDPKPGECGAQIAYDQAYHMADMPLEMVGIFNLGTGTPTFVNIPMTTLTAGGGGGGGSGSGIATQKIPPGQQNTPRPQNTKKPQPTKKNPGNGNGNGSANNISP